MRYLVIGNVAVLASRGIERIDASEKSTISVSVVGVPDGTSLNVIGTTSQKSYLVTSEMTEIPIADLGDGTYAVVVIWNETDPESKGTKRHEAYGNSFTVSSDALSRFIIPSPRFVASELDHMWKGISQTLEVLLPLIDEIKNGNDVI